MLKNSICSFFVFCCFILNLHAQEDSLNEVYLSSDYNIPNGTYLESILSSDQENIYLLRKNYPGGLLTSGLGPTLKSVIIESYDRENLKLQKAIEIDLKYQKKLRSFHEILNIKGNLFLITSFFNSAKKKNYLFAQKLSERFVPSDDLILIGEIDSRSEIRTGDFLVKHSRDTSKIIILHDLPTKRNENEQSKISVFDAEFEKIWDKRINLPFESKLYERLKFEVDKKGNAYVLGKHYFEKRKDSRKQKPNYEFILEAFTQSGEQKDKYQLNDKEKFISDLTFELNKNEQIICTGFYSEIKPNAGNSSSTLRNASPIKGMVFFNVDNKNKKIAEKTFTAFELDFIARNENKWQKRALERRANDNNKRNDPGLYSYDFREVILRSDGGAVVVAEQYYSYIQNDFNDSFLNPGFANRNFNNVGRIDSIHVFGDIIVVNINPDGSILWVNSVPKFQSSVNYNTYRYLSFASANYKDKIHMVFNERVDLFETDISLSEKLLRSNFNSYGLALATFDKRGDLDISLLAPNMKMGVQALPTLTKQISKNELIFYGQGGKEFKLGRVVLK